MSEKNRRIAAAVASAMASLAVCSSGLADNGSWSLNNAGTWNTGANWTGGTIADGTDSTATFANVITANRIVTVDTMRVIGNLAFTDTSHNYTLAAAGANTLTLDVTDGGGTTPQISVSNSSRAATISVPLAGNEGVQIAGAGVVLINAVNTYTGDTTVLSGTLRLNLAAPSGADGALGNATTAVRLGNTTGTAGAALQTDAAITVARDVLVRHGSSGTMTIAGNTAEAAAFSGLITLGANGAGDATKGVTLSQVAGGTLTFSNIIQNDAAFIGGTAGAVTKSGAGTVVFSAVNTYTGATTVADGLLIVTGSGRLGDANTSVTAGASLSLDAIAGNNAGRTITVNSSATALGAFGAGGNFLPASVNGTVTFATTSPDSDGILGVDTAGYDALTDLSSIGPNGRMYLGSTRTGTFTGASLAPGTGNTYRIGGGGGALTIANPVLAGANDLIVGSPADNGGGTVILGSLANSFTGTVAINNGTLRVSDVSNIGVNGPLGIGASAIVLGSATTPATLEFTGGDDSTDRGLTIGTGGGTVAITTNGTTLGFSALGGGPLTKTGPGALALPASVTLTGLTVAGPFPVPAGGTVTVNGGVTIANATSGNVTLGAGSTFTMNAAGSNFVLGNRTTVASNINDFFDGSDAQSVSITAAIVQIGTQSGNPDHTGSGPLVTFTLPSAPGTTSTINAATSILVGIGETNGAATAQGTLNLGGGSNIITTPLISLGEEKTSGILQFPASPGDPLTRIGSLTLSAAAGGKTNLTIGDNNLSGTGTNPQSTFNLTTSGTVNATLGNITMGVANRSALANGGAKAIFTLAAGDGLVTADSVILGTVVAGGSSNNNLVFTGTFNVGGGTFRFNTGAGNTFTTGANGGNTNEPDRTFTINVSGGSLDMNGQPINVVSSGVGATNLNLTGGTLDMGGGAIGSLTTFTFTGGGTLRDPASLAMPLVQDGANTQLDVASNDFAIAGAYTLTAGTAVVAAGRTLSATTIAVGSGGTLSGAGIISGPITVASGGTVSPGSSPGIVSTGDVTMSAGSNLIVELLGTTPGTGHDQLNVTGAVDVTGANLIVSSIGGINVGDAFTIILNDGAADPTGAFAQGATVAGPNGSLFAINYFGGDGNDVVLTTQAVPEPTAAAGVLLGAGMLALRRRRCERLLPRRAEACSHG